METRHLADSDLFTMISPNTMSIEEKGIRTAGLRRNSRTRISMIRISKVVKNSQVNGKDAHSSTTDSKRRHDPWNRRVRRPPKPEKTNGQEGSFDTSKMDSSFSCLGKVYETCHNSFLVDTYNGDNEDTDAHSWVLLVT